MTGVGEVGGGEGERGVARVGVGGGEEIEFLGVAGGVGAGDF